MRCPFPVSTRLLDAHLQSALAEHDEDGLLDVGSSLVVALQGMKAKQLCETGIHKSLDVLGVTPCACKR